jgi:PilZ domain
MTPERRQQPRVRLGHLAYIHVEPDSGAIVLDVSDGGIGFHSVAPFHNMGTISIRFSLQAHKHLKVSSEIAWVDETGKKGGLKLTDLSSDVRREIRTRLLTAPLRSQKESSLPLADTHQDLQETKLRAQSASISVPQPIEPPIGGISQQRLTSAVSQPKRRKLPVFSGVLAGLFLATGLAAICLLPPYRVQISRGILFPSSQSPAGEKYLELNGFSDIAGAQSAADMLTEKGLPVLLVHKDFLWMSFNSIFIGPYLTETNLADLRETLVSNGFTVESTTWTQLTRPPLLDVIRTKRFH